MRTHVFSAIAAASLFTTSYALPEAAPAPQATKSPNGIDPITRSGAKLFHKNSGEQFFIKGVAYQQGVGKGGSTSGDDNPPDPLADSDGCKRDIPLLKELDTNTIRVYAIDPKKNHDDCMSQLADAGIYVVADLSVPTDSINRDEPAWTDDLFNRYASVIDEMHQYDNFFGGIAGNEVSNAKNNTNASAFVKAAVRDMKAYVKTKKYREVLIGYATNDDADIREDMAKYFNCGEDSESVDFYGYNIYSFCGASSYTKSGYDVRTKEFSQYSVPAFFAEYGCNTPPRLFGDTPLLFSKPMSEVWSGGIVYMYFQEENNYGLVKVSGNSVSKLPSFDQYKKQIKKVDPQGTTLSKYNGDSLKPASCPSVGKDWEAKASPLPPAANPELCQCMVDSLTCVVKDSVSEKDYGDMFDYACENGDKKTCIGTQKDAKTGQYGAYSMCNPKEQLGWVLTQYQKAKGNADSACDFDGKATTQNPKNLAGSCKSLVSQAGDSGDGTVTSLPSTTGSDTDAAGHIVIPGFDFGLFKISVYVILAMISGSGLILL